MSNTQIEGMTQGEFFDLVAEIVEAEGADEHQDQLLEHSIRIAEHPSGSDLLYYPESPANGTPERIVEIVNEWRARNGLPNFKY